MEGMVKVGRRRRMLICLTVLVRADGVNELGRRGCTLAPFKMCNWSNQREVSNILTFKEESIIKKFENKTLNVENRYLL